MKDGWMNQEEAAKLEEEMLRMEAQSYERDAMPYMAEIEEEFLSATYGSDPEKGARTLREKAGFYGVHLKGELDAFMNRSGEKLKQRSGMGTVEVILIILVLIGLVIIFKTQLNDLVNSIFEKITKQAGSI